MAPGADDGDYDGDKDDNDGRNSDDDDEYETEDQRPRVARAGPTARNHTSSTAGPNSRGVEDAMRPQTEPGSARPRPRVEAEVSQRGLRRDIRSGPMLGVAKDLYVASGGV